MGANDYDGAYTQTNFETISEDKLATKSEGRTIAPLPISHLLLPGHTKSMVLDVL
jgi:hypothetical protein